MAHASGTESAAAQSLRGTPLFSRVPEPVLQRLLRDSWARRYPANQVLWNEGDPGDALLVLEAGLLRVSRFTNLGQEVVLAVLEPPAVLGELALLDGAPRDASVLAQRPVTVRFVPRSTFVDLLRSEPTMVDGLLRVLAGWVRAGNARHVATVALDVPGRFAAWLLARADRPGANGRVVLARSQGELAAELGTTRATLNRVIKGFEALHLIAVDGDAVRVLDRDELAYYTADPADG